MHLWAVSLLVQDKKYLGVKEWIKKLKKKRGKFKEKSDFCSSTKNPPLKMSLHLSKPFMGSWMLGDVCVIASCK